MSEETASFTTERARALVTAASLALEQRRQEIDDLNVYPVPDGDTGTNLSLTVKSVLKDVSALPWETGPAQLAGAVTNAALMGARGNSGVILSQMVRGAMEVLAEGGRVTPEVATAALRRATDSAYRAVRKPVEGTMLTVLKDVTAAAEEAAAAADEQVFLRHLIEAGWDSVRRTPTLLKVLAEAGVVDAGGFGLVVLLEGMAAYRGVADLPPVELVTVTTAAPGGPLSRFTYCTSFLLSGSDLDGPEIEAHLLPLGDSLLVVGDSHRLKVHIHTDEPGQVIDLATGRGRISEVEIDNMHLQTAERHERLRAESPPAQSLASTTAEQDGDEPSGPLTQVVAVVSGAGNKAIFQSLGAELIVEGGQSMNPAAEELLEAIGRASAPAVVVLPNNKNIIMTAEQVAGMTEKEVHVLHTKSIPAGLAALVAYDADLSGGHNAHQMQAAAGAVDTAEVTRAVRESSLNGLGIKEGSFIGIVNGELLFAAETAQEVLTAVAERLIDDSKEVVTVLLGEGGEQVAAAVAGLAERYPEVSVEVLEGGQSLYPVLMSVE